MDLHLLEQTLVTGCQEFEIPLAPRQLDLLLHFADLVFTANQRMNLTRITSAEDFAIKHFLDSLVLIKTGFNFAGPGIDVGTGAGFPGVVLACGVTSSSITLLDSLEKRVKFLEQVKTELNLPSIFPIHARAEDLARQPSHREKYRWAVARAVAPLPVLLEYCSPFVEVGGHFFAMKGQQGAEELAAAKRAVKILGLESAGAFDFQLPLSLGSRVIYKFRKKRMLAREFPRKAGVPTKKPL